MVAARRRREGRSVSREGHKARAGGGGQILLETFAKDTDRLRRFELEARTVAALNHPNILGIHDIGTYEGAPYLVSELLEGETLRCRQGRRGVCRTTEYALGVARGLAAAQEKGIVHRNEEGNRQGVSLKAKAERAARF